MANKSVSDLKRRANERRMLEIQMEGLRKNEKNWDSYIKSLDRKALVTKGLAYADLATGLGGIAKAVVKKAVKKLGRVAMNQGSKFAKRSTRATQSETGKKVASKAGKTRGKATTGDILGGTKTKRKASSKPAPKQSSMPQSMRKGTDELGRKLGTKTWPKVKSKKKMTEKEYDAKMASARRIESDRSGKMKDATKPKKKKYYGSDLLKVLPKKNKKGK